MPGSSASARLGTNERTVSEVLREQLNGTGRKVVAATDNLQRASLQMLGEEMTVDQVLEEVEKDGSFYREYGGGITLSGGECTLQADFCAALLAEAHRRGINTAIETAGNVPKRKRR